MVDGRYLIPGALAEQCPDGILVMHLPDDVPGGCVSGTCPPRGGVWTCPCVEGRSFQLAEVSSRVHVETLQPFACACGLLSVVAALLRLRGSFCGSGGTSEQGAACLF